MHSKPKLALAIITSPTAAFEEILDRKLFGTALFIAALAGTLSAIPYFFTSIDQGILQLFMLGKNNPVVWMGLFFLYSAIMWRLLKWTGTQISFVTVLTVMGWAQVALVVSSVALIIGSIAALSSAPSAPVISLSRTIYMALNLGYLIIIGAGIRTATSTTIYRGLLIYITVWVSTIIAFSLTYTSARSAAFMSAPMGIKKAAGTVASVDQIPWMAAATVGLVLGAWLLSRELEWDKKRRNMAILGGGLAGLVLLGIYALIFINLDYYGRVLKAARLYDNDEYRAAALQMRSILPIAPDNAELMIDIGNTYYLASDDELAVRYYKRAIKTVKDAQRPDENGPLAEAHNGLGMVYDIQGKYEAAIKEFDKATELWKTFRDPWIRRALTYNRIGEYDKAAKEANYALKDLDSDAAIAWLALAQAFTRQNDMTQAKTAIAMVRNRNEDLAKRIGDKAADWNNAIDKLTREDIKFPLDKELAPPPEKVLAKNDNAKNKSASPAKPAKDEKTGK